MKAPRLQTRHVLITGCSSGIGLAAARHLRDRGWNVLPTARKQEDLEMLSREGFAPIHLDMADTASVGEAAEATLNYFDGSLGGLVNNAGFGQPGAMEDLSREALRYQFEVNLFGMQELTNRFVPLFRRQGWGRIVHISSVLGRICMPFMGAYSASKFAMEAFADAMRVELRGSGVVVSLVEPGPIKTEFQQNAVPHVERVLASEPETFGADYRQQLARHQIKTDGRRTPFQLPPKAVAIKIRHALESSQPRSRYRVTVPTYVGELFRRFAPHALIDYMMWSRWRTRPGRNERAAP